MKGCAAPHAQLHQVAAASAILLLLLLPAHSQAATQLSSNAPFGAYLGCFSLSRMLYVRGVEGKEGKQYTIDTIRMCMPDCRYSGYSMSIITPDYRCWCAISIPDVQAQLEEAACAANSKRGAAVFYHHDFAGQQKCRLEALPLTPDTIDLTSGSSAAFNAPAQSMTLGMQGGTASHAAVKGSDMLYGQVEVTAMVNAASADFSTAFFLQSSSSGGGSASGALVQGVGDRISYQFITGGSPPVPNSVLVSSTSRGAAMGEQLLKPGEYQKRLGLGWNSRVNNTFVDYTISWQSSRVTFAMNGVPLVTRKVSQEVKWDASNKQLSAIFQAPSQPASIHFGVWTPSSLQQQQQQQQQQSHQQAMLPNGLPALSQFTALKRIVCDQLASAAASNHRSVRGPPWLYVGQSWDASDNFDGADDYVTSSSSSDGSGDSSSLRDGGSSSGDHGAAGSSTPADDPAGFDLHQLLPFGWPGIRISSRPLVRPAPPPPGTALAGQYAGGFSVTLSPSNQHQVADLDVAAPLLVSSRGGYTTGFITNSADYAQQQQQDLQQPEEPATSAPAAGMVSSISSSSSGSKVSRPAGCRVAVVPFGICGGASRFGDCLGRKCRDAPWPGHCCKQGFDCTRKSSQIWSCEPPAACPQNEPSSAGHACEWEVLRDGVCGGLGSGCQGCQCRDSQWQGFCCSEGLTCSRRSRWAWVCA